MTEQVQGDEIETRAATGAELVEWLNGPSYAERRNESTMRIAETIGIDNARRLMQEIRWRENAIYTLFWNEQIPPAARLVLDAFLGQWVQLKEDWTALAAEHDAAKPPKAQVAEEVVELPEDGEAPSARLGGHVADMDASTTTTGMHESTNQFYFFRRFRRRPQKG